MGILTDLEKLKIIDVVSATGDVSLEDYEAVIESTKRIEAKFAGKLK